MTKNFKAHHFVWLLNHPSRSSDWLSSMLADDFHIHHIDGNHDNNAPDNLILIEACDHAMVHLAPSFRVRRINKISLNDAKAQKTARRVGRVRYKFPIGPVAVFDLNGYRAALKSRPPEFSTLCESHNRQGQEMTIQEFLIKYG